MTAADIIAVHDEVALTGDTWHYGIREPASLDHLADQIRELARQRRGPERIAAFAMTFIVREHPFWDVNHRTAFQFAELVLEAFNQELVIDRDEAEQFVRGVDRSGLGEDAILAWMHGRIRELR